MDHIIEFQKWLLNNPVNFGIFFVAMWFIVSITFSRVTGWSRLAEKYRATSKSESKLMRAVQVYWGSILLAGNIYTLGSSSKGMFLGVLFPFRLGHPPLLIPWHEIKAKRVNRLFMPRIQLSFGNGLSRPFEINENVAEKIKAGSNGQFIY